MSIKVMGWVKNFFEIRFGFAAIQIGKIPNNKIIKGSVGKSVPNPLGKVISVERGSMNKRRKKTDLGFRIRR
jgi:hypothetical protein